jgi:Ca-activated chloride channel homolog
MRRAAEFGGGTFTHIGQIDEVLEKMDLLYKKIDNPVATDINIHWPNTVESYPARIPTLYQGDPLLVMAKASYLAGDVIVTGRTVDNLWRQSLSLETGNQGRGVASLWAR